MLGGSYVADVFHNSEKHCCKASFSDGETSEHLLLLLSLAANGSEPPDHVVGIEVTICTAHPAVAL